MRSSLFVLLIFSIAACLLIATNEIRDGEDDLNDAGKQTVLERLAALETSQKIDKAKIKLQADKIKTLSAALASSNKNAKDERDVLRKRLERVVEKTESFDTGPDYAFIRTPKNDSNESYTLLITGSGEIVLRRNVDRDVDVREWNHQEQVHKLGS